MLLPNDFKCLPAQEYGNDLLDGIGVEQYDEGKLLFDQSFC